MLARSVLAVLSLFLFTSCASENASLDQAVQHYLQNIPERITLAPEQTMILDFPGVKYISSNPKVVSIDRNGLIQVAKDAVGGSKVVIKITFPMEEKKIEVTIKQILSKTIVKKGDYWVVNNPGDQLVVVNKKRFLPANYVPVDLAIPNVPFKYPDVSEIRYLRESAANALERCFLAAKEEGIFFVAVSGYRSYQTQKSLFDRYSKRMGYEQADRVSAHPGSSEHQTGLAMDVTSKEVNTALVKAFGNTRGGKWLQYNASKYGFIIRYPKGREEDTGYMYEPWHLRYVGREVATEIMANNWILEEYFHDVSEEPILHLQ